ncbi:flagellar assembly protein FliH [Azonexus caeni]|uniref:flagellar assembly protein FliH n=1 Tax=Azonexus caeni TaxID=266126 RepID=UPI003A8C7BDB
MAGVIPKEQLAAYQRWQANAFDAPAAPPAAPAREAEAAPGATLPEAEVESVSAAAFALPTADEIEQMHEQAHDEGYRAGYEEGLQAAQAATLAAREQEVARLAAMTGALREALNRLDQEVAEQLLDLALEVAAQVVGSSLKTQRELLLPVIREALQALPLHHGSIALHANPDDLDHLRDALDELVAQSNLKLVPDSGIAPGGCLLKAGHSEVDASLATRWKRVLEAIGVDPDKWLLR